MNERKQVLFFAKTLNMVAFVVQERPPSHSWIAVIPASIMVEKRLDWDPGYDCDPTTKPARDYRRSIMGTNGNCQPLASPPHMDGGELQVPALLNFQGTTVAYMYKDDTVVLRK